MSHVEDTQIKDGNYEPGTLLENGKRPRLGGKARITERQRGEGVM